MSEKRETRMFSLLELAARRVPAILIDQDGSRWEIFDNYDGGTFIARRAPQGEPMKVAIVDHGPKASLAAALLAQGEPSDVEALVDSLEQHVQMCEANGVKAIKVPVEEITMLCDALRPQEVADAELDSVEVARTISRARQSGEDVEAIADKCPGCGQHHPIVETLVTRCSGCDTILRSRASKGETDRELWFSTSYKMGEDTYYRAYETNCRKGLVRGVVRFARLAGEDHGSRFMNQEREDDHER